MNRLAIQAGALRALETVVWGALVAGLQASEPLLSTPSFAAVDWASVAHTFLAAALVALLAGVGSYHAAVGAGAGSAAPAAAGPAAAPGPSAAPPPAGSSAAPPEPVAGQ